MLELIFQGFFEWIYGMILEAWEFFSGKLIDLMSMDFSYLQTHIPVLPVIRQSMLAVGWALLLGNLVFQAMRSMMTGLGFEAEDPKLLFTRTFVFSFLLMASPQICDLCLSMTSTVMDIMGLPNAANIQLIQISAFNGLACAWLLVFICGIIVMFQSFKLIFEMAERYFILAVLTITAPLAFGMGGSRNTSDIFTGWCRMYGSMCLLMVLNVVFVKMLLSVLSTVPTGLAVLPWMVLILTIVKVAKKADAIVARIGLNPAITGDRLGRSGLPGILAYTVMRTMVSNAVNTVAKNHAGEKRGETDGKGGKPNYGNPAAPGKGAGASSRSHTGRNTKTNVQNAAAEQSGQSRAASARPVTVIPDDKEDAAMNGPAPASGASVHTQTGSGTAKSTERKTSVPSGAVRSPGVIKQNTATGGSNTASSQSTRQVHTQSEKSPAATAHNPATHPGAAGKAALSTPQTAPNGGKAPRPGTAGTGTGSPQHKASGSGARLQRGAAGTAQGASGNDPRGSGASDQHGTAGTATTQANIRNSPRVVQSHAAQSSVQASQQSGGTPVADAAKPVGGASPQNSELKSTRFSQRPLGARSGVVRVVSSKTVAAGAAEPKPVTAGREVLHGTAPAAVASRLGTAQQEPRAPRPSGSGVEPARKAPAPASQESHTARPPVASSGSMSKPTVSAPARQESRAAHPASVRTDTARKSSSPTPAQRESKARTKNKFPDKNPRLRHGTAGIAPTAARNTHADQSERAPRQEQTPNEPKLNDAAAAKSADAKKDGDASD